MAEILIVGAGIGGLSCAISLSAQTSSLKHKLKISLTEQSDLVGEVGAGVQLGPNVTRILRNWGLEGGLKDLAFEPSHLEVRGFGDERLIAQMPLGQSFRKKYGAPYLGIHRADLHSLLYKRVIQEDQLNLMTGTRVINAVDDNFQVRVELESRGSDKKTSKNYDALVGVDGVWSQVRGSVICSNSTNSLSTSSFTRDRDDKSATSEYVNPDKSKALNAEPFFSGAWAYRCLVPQVNLPVHLRQSQIRLLLGPQVHCVMYPVKGGEWLNVVLIIDNSKSPSSGVEPLNFDLRKWQFASRDESLNAYIDQYLAQQLYMTRSSSRVQETLGYLKDWSAWPIMNSKPVQFAQQMAKGRIALLGDAAHCMLPYLAQGAGMAIEDAHCLGHSVGEVAWQGALFESQNSGFAESFKRYAELRWQRNAEVQKRAARNSKLFHAQSGLAFMRDLSLKIMGPNLLDMPWLYGYKA